MRFFKEFIEGEHQLIKRGVLSILLKKKVDRSDTPNEIKMGLTSKFSRTSADPKTLKMGLVLSHLDFGSIVSKIYF